MPARKYRSYGVLSVVVVAALLCGCEQTKISDILKNPVYYEGNEVTIAGKVTQSGGGDVPSAYQIDDGTGRIWVVAENIELPASGSRVVVSGLVISSGSQRPLTAPTVLQEMKRSKG